MEYITQNELKRMFLLSYERIEEKKEEINKINVFPVPDQDTGTNLAKTLEGIKKEIEGKEFKDLEEISKVALDGALISAQGNAGVIYTGFLAGFLPKLNKNPVDAKKLAEAFEEGRKRAWKSMANPKGGTILDVIDAAAETFKKEAEKEKDIVKIFEKVIEKAKEALLATREKMEIFKKANVVDAGGLGFLMILESYLEALKPEGKKEEKKERPSEEIRRFVQVLTNRFEVVALIFDPRLDEEKVREKLKRLGNCLDIVKVENKMKVHIHTDYPDEVRDVLRKIGRIEDLRIEDMAKEIAGEPSVRKVSIGIVTEDVASILPKILERYQIELAKTKFDWPELEKIEGRKHLSEN
jgi:dihydroxyacetone kinase-like predicted kinase